MTCIMRDQKLNRKGLEISEQAKERKKTNTQNHTKTTKAKAPTTKGKKKGKSKRREDTEGPKPHVGLS